MQPWMDCFGKMGRFWLCDDAFADPWEVFRKQWNRWQDFRKWQRDNRDLLDGDIDDGDGGFAGYVEQHKVFLKQVSPEAQAAKRLAEIEADPSYLRDTWEEEHRLRLLQRHHCTEKGRGRDFAGYLDAAKRRLSSHGFTQAFHFDEDPKQQDHTTTWIEYLYYECWWIDRLLGKVGRRQPKADQAWQKLLDAQVLRADETPETITLDRYWVQLHKDEERAQQKIDRETQTGSAGHDAELHRRLAIAVAELGDAKSQHEATLRRRDSTATYIRATSSIRQFKEDIARHRTLIPWIRDQICAIEAERCQRDPGCHTTRGRKRELEPDEGTLRGSQRQMLKLSAVEDRQDHCALDRGRLPTPVIEQDETLLGTSMTRRRRGRPTKRIGPNGGRPKRIFKYV